ncbi:hypothetical protein [Altererythrobacter sp. Root672]|uniref:hypothetical protein n=1 Tax=Altererythrobacter sp. Root672 TaxID=1736584 RepID=UPI0006F6ED79|nr:hypothetical protein [Altererythrobacter sp. Root672]KRA84144.1 hypothetical protein ASD76_09165 [Altererythrobacter sp. Root672]
MSQELLIAASALSGLLVVAFTLLKGWQDWLELKSRELETGHGKREIEGGAREGAARIEIADLKERIRKLEAIASGVDL